VTIPIAQIGYWFSLNNVSAFYKCYPANSCGGGSAENCTNGYSGQLCGRCITNWFKEKNKCVPCGPFAFILLKLLIVGSFGFVLILIMFFISSNYPTLLTSLGIAIAYWQILSIIAKFDVEWPIGISNSLDASSASVFQVIPTQF
jgi:hypothetical protein